MRILLLIPVLSLVLSCAGTSPRFINDESPAVSDQKMVLPKERDQRVKRSGRITVDGVRIKRRELSGVASWYGKALHGKKTASGEKFDMNAFTAAHRTIPFGTIVEVTDRETGNSVKVRINDRGPHSRKRVIDLSEKAASKLGITRQGTARVSIQIVK